MQRQNFAKIIAVGTVALVLGVGSTAYAFADNVKTIVNTAPGEIAGCGPDESWRFWITNVAGSTGVEPPASITATLANGNAVTVPLTEVIGDSDEFPNHVAYYSATSSTRFTGDAEAEIDSAWNPLFSSFMLISGPCRESTATISVVPTVVRQRQDVTTTGRLTAEGGTPLTGQTAFIRWHNVEADGKGIVLGPFTTDGNGFLTATVKVSTAGPQHFTVEYGGGGPTGVAQTPADAETVAWSLAPSAHPSAGTLVSSGGTVFTPSMRTTVVSGTGYAPNDIIGIALYPSRILLATTTTDENGSFAVSITLPSDASGGHELVSLGIGVRADNLVVRYLNLGIKIRK